MDSSTQAVLTYGAQMGAVAGDMAMQYSAQKWNEKEAKKVRKWNEEMYQRQLEDNRENWRMMNEYNLPSAQLARLRDAGLNPLLMYSNGASGMVAADTAKSADVNSAPAAHHQYTPQLASAMQSLALMGAQVENIKADSRLKNAEAAKQMDELAFNRSTWDYRKDALFYENELKSSMYYRNQAERDKLYEDAQQARKTIEALDAEITNKTRMTDQEIKESEQRIVNSVKQTAASVSLMNAEARKNMADAYYANAMAAIVSDPRYKDAAIKEKVENVRAAIANASAAEIEKSILELKQSLMPIGNEWYNRAGYAYKKFVELTVGPIADLLGKALGGTVPAVIKK